jgi:hypothetical protein
MAYRAIPDSEIAAYRPVTSRLVRGLRGNARGATWTALPPAMLAGTTWSTAVSGTGALDSGWVEVGSLWLWVPAHLGAANVAAAPARVTWRVWLEIEQTGSAADKGVAQVRIRNAAVTSSVHAVGPLALGPGSSSLVVTPTADQSWASPQLTEWEVDLRAIGDGGGPCTYTARFRADQDGGRIEQAA